MPSLWESCSADAIKTGNFKDIKSHAHKLSSLARHIAAKQLVEKASRLEHLEDEKDIETAVFLFDHVRTEFEKVVSFLSEDNWIEMAKQQASRQIEKEIVL